MHASTIFKQGQTHTWIADANGVTYQNVRPGKRTLQFKAERPLQAFDVSMWSKAIADAFNYSSVFNRCFGLKPITFDGSRPRSRKSRLFQFFSR
jgi:hypothetical protein